MTNDFDFSSDAIAEIENPLNGNQDFCKQQMTEKAFARWLPNQSESLAFHFYKEDHTDVRT